MQEATNRYIETIRHLYARGDATEHSYRTALQQFIESMLPGYMALNERKRETVGAPDFVLFKKDESPTQGKLFADVPLGFVEAKDIKPGILDRPEHQEQIQRYMELGNLVHTDGLEFRFYFDKEFVRSIRVGYVNDAGHIVDTTNEAAELQYYFQKIVERAGQTVRSAKTLAILMADRARPIRYTILQALQQDIDTHQTTTLTQQYDAFRETLIHDMKPEDFADIYAETIAYGLFAARYNDETQDDFTLFEAAQKIPQTNPFLKQFFLEIAAYEQDSRIDWVLNNFVDLFRHTDVRKIMSTYGVTTGMNHDPVTHFYETFLGEYDPKRRKARGVYYTPLPVVQYIVNAVDKVLKEEFGLADGLADDSTVSHTFRVDPYRKGKSKDAKVYHEETREIPRVQILDPATGTSTFLNETIKLIAERKKHLGSSWSSYVEQSLLPRVHGFEILMAAYSMAHMRLGLTLSETGYVPSANAPRLSVYLTNTLEAPAEDEPPLLSMLGMGRVLTEEAVAADKVKRDLPIMVVMGNPPYSGHSANNSKYANSLVNKYKFEPGGNEKLKERNSKWLNDDYVKFLSYADGMVANSGKGVVAMITNNAYLNNPTFRGMRWKLLETYSKIYVIDLHGNAQQLETSPDGSRDENVFDIMQGVSILVGVLTTEKTDPNSVKIIRADLFGTRQKKYEILCNGSISWTEFKPSAPFYIFEPTDNVLLREYGKNISLKLLYNDASIGIQTHADSTVLSFEKDRLQHQIESAGYIYREADHKQVTYRPFDKREYFEDDNIVQRSRRIISSNMDRPNFALCFMKQYAYQVPYSYALITDSRVIDRTFISNKGAAYFAPLYIYHPDGTVTANFNDSELKKLLVNLEPYCYVDRAEDLPSPQPDMVITALDVLDYVYGVLHSPSYRTKYKEFLKIDFPRVPIPDSQHQFWHFAETGAKLRELHLMHDVTPYHSPLTGEGDNVVDKLRFVPGENAIGSVGDTTGSVYINDSQYFANVPEIAWNFYIGGYQPAQKWLKDRRGRPLGYKDVEHYQRIVTILVETDHVMKTIDR